MLEPNCNATIRFSNKSVVTLSFINGVITAGNVVGTLTLLYNDGENIRTYKLITQGDEGGEEEES